MAEIKKGPFEQAQENIRSFAESADMLGSISKIRQLLADIEKMPELEKETVETIVNATLESLSRYLIEKGGKWN
jgi:hypothetical protein